MLDQKEKVQKVYADLTNDELWIAEYVADPDMKLDEYGISPENKVSLKKIISLFC